MNLTTFTHFFVGMLGMMLLYMLINWLIIRKKEYFHYAGYIALCSLYISIQNLVDFGEIPLHTAFSYFISFTSLSLPTLMFVAYNNFMLYFLDLHKTENKAIFKQIKLQNFLLFVFIFLDFMLFLSEQNQLTERAFIYFWTSLITLPLETRVIYWLWSVKNKLRIYFLTGTLALILSNIISLSVSLMRDMHIIVEPPFEGPNGQTIYSPTFYLQIGIIIELLCFSLGLGYKRHLSEKEKSQMELQLEKEKVLFETQLMSSKMTALRAQINPHFVNNSLNAINLLILQGENKAAANYLTKFSRLFRLVLNNSAENVIPLEQELEAVNLYVEMESLRFNHEIDYELYVSPSVDKEKTQIPPMLIQPYIENAIWHGLLPKTDYRHLLLEISKEENNLIIVIEDNGIGIKKAMENKAKKGNNQQSLGMKLTEERIRLFNKNQSTNLAVEIEELVEPSGISAGTRVTLLLGLG